MSSGTNLIKLDLESQQISTIICSKEVTSVSGLYETAKTLNVTGDTLNISKLLPIFSDIPDIIKNVKNFVDSSKSMDAVKLINNYLFNNFKQIALLFQQTIHDETELPSVATKIMENKIISENTWFDIMNALLILDGLNSQVSVGESLSTQDFNLLANSLLKFQEISIVMSKVSAMPLQDNLAQFSLYDISRVTGNSSFYFTCPSNTFSTASNTIRQSSIVTLI